MADSPPPKSGNWWVLILAFALVFAAWLIALNMFLGQWREPRAPDETALARSAQTGDSFGAFNALIAGLGFAGVAFTLYRQHQDGMEAEERHQAALDAQERIAKVNALTAIMSDIGAQYAAIQSRVQNGGSHTVFSMKMKANRAYARKIRLQMQAITGLDLGAEESDGPDSEPL